LKSKVVTKEEALTKFHDGQTIMFGDWHGELSAEEIITGMLEKGVKDIHAIAVSGGMPDQGVGRLINERRVVSLATTHIGLNPVAKDQMFAGELDVEFIPQGTFAERIRCGGSGLGGCLTPTGIGTDVEKGKQKLTINGKEYMQMSHLLRHGKPTPSAISNSDCPAVRPTVIWLMPLIPLLLKLRNWLKSVNLDRMKSTLLLRSLIWFMSEPAKRNHSAQCGSVQGQRQKQRQKQKQKEVKSNGRIERTRTYCSSLCQVL
jgi:hypothetical protein